MHAKRLQQEPQFIPISQAAEKLGISKPLTYRIVREGRLKVHNFGKKCLRVNLVDLEKYIQSAAQ